MVPGPDFADSYARLSWVRILIVRASVLAGEVFDRQEPRALLDHVEVEGQRYLRYRLPRMDFPDELGFLVGDIVMNARSCLDMAMQSISDVHQTGWAKPQFPIVDSIDDEDAVPKQKKNQVYSQAEKYLSVECLDLVRSLQPRYTDAWGPRDIPTNSAAVVIRELSNANKHRRLTPVMPRIVLRGTDHNEGVQWVDSTEQSPLPWDDQTQMILRAPADQFALEDMLSIRVHFLSRLVIEAGTSCGVQIPDCPRPVPVTLEDVTEKIPAYVARALKRLGRA